MQDPQNIYRTILGLVTMNDGDLLDELCVKGVMPAEHINIYRAVRVHLEEVLAGYDYTKSPAFEAATRDMKVAAVALKRRFEAEPVKRLAHKKRFINALRSLPESSEVFGLLDTQQHSHLHEALRLVMSLRGRNVG